MPCWAIELIIGLIFLHLDFVGYLINPTSGVVTTTVVRIGDKLDRNTNVSVDNCTQLVCQPNGLKRQKVPCRGKMILLLLYIIYWLHYFQRIASIQHGQIGHVVMVHVVKMVHEHDNRV